MISETTQLRPDSMVYLVKALILVSLRPKDKVHGDRAALFSLDLLVHVTVLNQERIMLFWSLVRDHLFSFISKPDPPSPGLFEKAVLSLLYLSIHVHNPEISEQLLRTLFTISELPPQTVEPFAEKFMLAVSRIPKNVALAESTLYYQAILQLLQFASDIPKSAPQALQILCLLVSNPQFLQVENFAACLRVFLVFMGPSFPSSFAINSMQSLDHMFSQVLPLLGLSPDPLDEISTSLLPSQIFAEKAKRRKIEEKKKSAWVYFWAPVLQILCELCKDERGDVRNHAMSFLQKSLLSSPLEMVLTAQGWFICFEEVVFPLLNELLKPQEIDSISLEELRLRAAVLLSKLFLQNMQKIIAGDGFEGLWMRILHFVEKYMKADHSELLAEAVPESLKIMIASDLFHPGGILTGTGEDLWLVSWQIIDSFCPSIKSDVLVKIKPHSSPSPSPSLSSSPSPSPSLSPSPVSSSLPSQPPSSPTQPLPAQQPLPIQPLQTPPSPTLPKQPLPTQPLQTPPSPTLSKQPFPSELPQAITMCTPYPFFIPIPPAIPLPLLTVIPTPISPPSSPVPFGFPPALPFPPSSPLPFSPSYPPSHAPLSFPPSPSVSQNEEDMDSEIASFVPISSPNL